MYASSLSNNRARMQVPYLIWFNVSLLDETVILRRAASLLKISAFSAGFVDPS